MAGLIKIKDFAIIFTVSILFLAFISMASADEFDYARTLMQSKVSCDQLNESQLEQLGDYFMEQMHPGELHEIMEDRLGGEGSESLRLAHINMGQVFYCGESGRMYSGMMNVMMGRSGGITRSGSMMGRSYNNLGDYGYNNSWSLTSTLLNLILLLVVVLMVVWIVKLTKRKKR